MNIVRMQANDEHWYEVAQFAKHCSWRAGVSLASSMEEKRFTDWESVFVAYDGYSVAGFCTLAKTDCIEQLPYMPYIGFVFVDEQYRGYRLSERLLNAASDYAKQLSFAQVYLISDQVNFYEKYGFMAIDKQMAPWGKVQTIYCKEV